MLYSSDTSFGTRAKEWVHKAIVFSIILMALYTSQPTCVCFLCDTPRAAAAASLPAVSPPLALSGGGTPGQDI